MACSKVYQNPFHNHLIANPFGGHPVEDPTHFLLNCPGYAAIRIELANNIALISRVTMVVLLYGNTELGIDENKHIFDEVHKFIRLSYRLE